MSRIKHVSAANRSASGHRWHINRPLVATIAAAIVCALVAVAIIGIISIIGITQKQPNDGDGSQASKGSKPSTLAPLRAAPTTGIFTGTATLNANPTAAQPSPTEQPRISEVLPPLEALGPVDAGNASDTGNTSGTSDTRYYTETGHYMSGDFLQFYDNVPDSADLFGLPLTEEFSQPLSDGTTISMQYFERARLEYHPGSSPQMQLGILAPQILQGRTFDPLPPVPSTDSRLYFAETGHTLSGGFLDFWNSHGGLAIFGYPVSEEVVEDGLTVQYFERARMEYHKDLQGTPYAIQLSPVGYLALKAQFPDLPNGTMVSFNPPEVAEGHTTEISVSVPAGVSVTGSYEGRPLLFTYDPARGVAWALTGAVAFQDVGVHQVVINLNDGSDEGRTIVRNLQVLSYPFPSEDLQFDAQTAKLLASQVITDEEASLAAVFAGRTPHQYWHGPFRIPLDGPMYVTSYFGARRCYNCPDGAPTTTYHPGIDLAAEVGTPVHAAADGMVVFTGALADRGNTIIIDHGLGVYTLYAHNSRLIAQRGWFVHQGDIISLSGNTGLSNGPHLHWEMHVSGPSVDPREFVTRSFP